jgi:hypothetical protein
LVSEDLFPITVADKLAELERELAIRFAVYPRWVHAGKLAQQQANRQMAVLKAIREDYLRQSEDERHARAEGLSGGGAGRDPG